MAIIFISFVILALVLCTMVESYSTDIKTDMVERTASVASDSITKLFVADEAKIFEHFLVIENEASEKPYIEQMLSALADFSNDIHIILVSRSGEYLLSDTETPESYLGGSVPTEIMNKLTPDTTYSEVGDLGGVLNKEHLVHISPITDVSGEYVGAALVCSLKPLGHAGGTCGDLHYQ